ncbi:MAG: hypothetical protein ACJ75P_02270 [Gaiellaceae bacterium]
MRKQLDRHGQRVDPKTEESQRDVLLLPTIAKVLRELKLASSYAAPSDFVFASETGTPLQARNASRRGLVKAVEAAGLKDDTRRSAGTTPSMEQCWKPPLATSRQRRQRETGQSPHRYL